VRRVVMGSLAVVAMLTGCGGEADEGGSAPQDPATSASPDTTESSAPPAESASPGQDRPPDRLGTVVTTASSDYGTMLFDRSGQAIYLFDRETSDRPRCYGGCADAWPPVLTEGEPQAIGRVRSGLLATTERKDGTLQVTYAGHPLYYYAHEGKSEVLCHDVVEYGGTWLVVRPNGEAAP
jgi:predicted lipoprotein with Yx(FWY)xxD motif